MSRPPRNIAASVHARLLSRARESREDFQFVLHRYAAERFLYRLGKCGQRERYVLKGAMLFALWGGSLYRPTSSRHSPVLYGALSPAVARSPSPGPRRGPGCRSPRVESH